MSVRKRIWTTSLGEQKEAWIVDYFDQDGDRHIETFQRKKDAEARHDKVRLDVRHGVHTAVSKSETVAEAAARWHEVHGIGWNYEMRTGDLDHIIEPNYIEPPSQAENSAATPARVA